MSWANLYNGSTWLGWVSMGFSNVSASVGTGGNSYTAPQTGKYFYTCASEVSVAVSEMVPKVNGVAKGTTKGSDGCLGCYGESWRHWCAYILELKTGDVITGRSFYINLLI